MKKSAFLSIAAAVLICCAIAQAWTTPQPVTSGINTSNDETLPFMSFDGKSLYFSRNDGGGYNIYQATRSDTSGSFTSASEVLDHDGNYHVMSPWVSQDNLRMYYYEDSGAWQLKVSMRNSASDPWTSGTIIPGLGSFANPDVPKLSQDELTIVFGARDAAGGLGGYDIWMASRPNTSSPFGNIRNLSEINSSALDNDPYLTPDGLAVYFHSARNGQWQLFKATRQSLNDTFGNLEHLSFFDSPYGVASPSLSADGSTLFFVQGAANGDRNIYYSEVPEPVTLMLLGLGGLLLRKKI